MKPHDLISLTLLFTLVGAGIIGLHLEPWIYMWLLAGLLFANFKWLSLIHHPKVENGVSYAPTYLLAWIGMDPTPFQEKSQNCRNKNNPLLLRGMLNLLLGITLIHTTGLIPNQHRLLQGWVACVGIIFVLHFGLFKINAWLLRSRGFDVQPIMELPIATRKISEFWGGRWNKAFNQLVHPFVYTPLKRKFGPTYSLVLTFLFSGLIHELVISLPAKSGWGLPTLYFLIQAVGMIFERTKPYRQLSRPLKQAFTYLIIAGPAFILFHPPFMKTVILPFIQSIGVGV